MKAQVELEAVERLRLGEYALKPTGGPTWLKWPCLRENKRKEEKAGDWDSERDHFVLRDLQKRKKDSNIYSNRLTTQVYNRCD